MSKGFARKKKKKNVHTAKYVFLRFLFDIVSTKYGAVYTAKYEQLRQITKKSNLSAKKQAKYAF